MSINIMSIVPSLKQVDLPLNPLKARMYVAHNNQQIMKISVCDGKGDPLLTALQHERKLSKYLYQVEYEDKRSRIVTDMGICLEGNEYNIEFEIDDKQLGFRNTGTTLEIPNPNKTNTEALTFVLHELYEDREQVVYEFLGNNTVKNKLIFLNKLTGQVMQTNQDGTYNNSPSKRDIIKKHEPKKEHNVKFLVDIFKNKVNNRIYVVPHISLPGLQAAELIASGIEFERTVYEGEGLNG